MSRSPVADLGLKSWQGSLDLVFGRRQQRTQLIHSYARSPLKIQRSFYPEGPQVAHNVILHTAGGMVGGDRLSLKLQLDSDAQALITTAAAAKLYRSSGLEAQQTIQIQLEPGACLEWLPQETIVFNGAIYRQDLQVELAANATWLGWEITRFGRSARGEKFLQGHWRSRTQVWRQGRPLWVDAQWLPAGRDILSSPHGLKNYPVIGSFAFVGRAVDADLVAQARSLWATEHQGEAGVTRLQEGLLCRYRGFSTLVARSWFTKVWHLLRLSFLERPACPPRVWPQ